MNLYFRRTLSSIMFVMVFCMVSCFDDKYDLKKDIDMSITVGGETLVIPLGETEVITLDKVIDESETFKLGVDSIYAFKKKDAIDDVNIDVDAVNITVESPDIDPIDVSLGENTQIDPFKVDLMDPVFAVDVEDIKVDESKLPDVDFAVDQDLVCIPNLAVNHTFDLSSHKDISVALSASTFKDVKEVREVYFGKENQKQLVTFSINTTDINKMLKEGSVQKLDFLEVRFPEGFVLSSYDNYNNTLIVDGNVIKVSAQNITGNEGLSYQFYVDKFVHTFSAEQTEYTGSLDFSLKYTINGTFVSTPDLQGNFSAGLSSVEKFSFDKAAVVTRDVDVNVESGLINFDTDIDGLEDLASVKQILFKENTVFDLELNNLDLPFDFQSNSKFVIEVPKILDIVPIKLPDGVEFDQSANRLTVSASVLKNKGNVIQLGLQKIDFTKDNAEGKLVENGHLKVAEEISYYAASLVDNVATRGKLVVQGGNVIYTDELLGLHRELKLQTSCGTAGTDMLDVENAVVVANSVSSDVSTNADFEIAEDMPDEVKALKTVALKDNKPAKFTLKVDFREMPKDIKKGLVLSPLTVDLPKFILFGENPDIDENNVMTLNETFVPSESNAYTYVKEIEVYGMDFTKIEEFQSEGIKIGEDHILTVPSEYTKVEVTGAVRTCEGEEVNSNNLEDFKIYPTVIVEDMTIGEVVGKVDPKIDPVEELVDLDLDDDLDFLKNDSNELHIKNPIINVKLQSNVGVPVNLDLVISGHKEGVEQPIEGSLVTASTATYPEFKLYPAIDRENPVTTYILISREPVNMGEDTETEKYVNLVLPNLSNLLVHLPDQVKFTLNASADQSVDHEVDITPNFNENGKDKVRFLVTGDYDVTVPLVFEAIDINYADSVDNLNEDLWDFLDVAMAAELDVKAELINTLPANLNLNATAVDFAGNELTSIRLKTFINDVEDGIIPGVAVEGQKETVNVRIELRATDAAELKRLDKLMLNVGAVIKETNNGLPLKGNQSIQFVNIKAYVKKVNLDLN